MKSINIRDAKAHLFRLIERVEAGEEFVISKAGRPAARLVPLGYKREPVKIGGLKAPTAVPDDFNTMLESDIEAMFGGCAPVVFRQEK